MHWPWKPPPEVMPLHHAHRVLREAKKREVDTDVALRRRDIVVSENHIAADIKKALRKRHS